MTERLTTLAAVKEWLGVTNVASDDQLLRIIDAASRFIVNWLNRDTFAARNYTQHVKGNGSASMLLRNWPVISVTSLGVGGQSIPASTVSSTGLPSSGYTVGDPRQSAQSLDLWGYYYMYNSPVQVVYRAGYEMSESFVLVADELVTPTEGGQWIETSSVFINAVEAAPVEGAPAVGQYSVDDWGVHSFNDADAGKTAVITYSYVPPDVSWGAVEVIGEWYRRKDRIGILSKTLGGQETITFSQKELSDVARGSLQPYMNVVPI